MKKNLFVVAAISMATCVFAQEGKKTTPPAAVKAAFDKAYPGMSGAKWEKEEGEYEASFKKDGKKMSVVYDAGGVLKETEVTIAEAALPAGVVTYVKAHYKNAAIKDPSKTTKADGTVIYEVEIKEETLVFDASGKFIKVEKEKGEEEKD